jgi:exodeoxyribonuclease V alpha subunit
MKAKTLPPIPIAISAKGSVLDNTEITGEEHLKEKENLSLSSDSAFREAKDLSEADLHNYSLENLPTSIQAEITRIIFYNQDNGYAVLKFEAKDFEFTGTGSFNSPAVGERFDLEGKWVQDNKYGPQLRIDCAMVTIPTSIDGIEAFLSSGIFAGIGKVLASRIVEMFKEQSITIMEQEPRRLLMVPGIGEKNFVKIEESIRQNVEFRHTLLFLYRFNITGALAKRIIDFYGKKTLQVLQENPYNLVFDMERVSFLKADEIAMKMGFNKFSPLRVRCAIRYVMQHAENSWGFTYFNEIQIFDQLNKMMNISNMYHGDLISESLAYLCEEGLLFFEDCEEQGAVKRIYALHNSAMAEYTVAEKISTLLKQEISTSQQEIDKWIDMHDMGSGIKLSEAQKGAVSLAIRSPIFILTGGPGVGKTTTSNAIINFFWEKSKAMALCAPTGRAAQRLKELCTAPITPTTIHRLLKWDPVNEEFLHNESNPLDIDVLIMDEVSMLDVKLAAKVLTAITDTTQVILLGDVDQLPPVGIGNVLSDLIESGMIPLVKLTEVFRQAAKSDIIKHVHEINHGVLPKFDYSIKNIIEHDPLDGPIGCDCVFAPYHESEDIIKSIEDFVKNQIAKVGNFDPLKDVQILSPMNVGELGTEALNLRLQRVFNPPKSSLADSVDLSPHGSRRGSKGAKAGGTFLTVNGVDFRKNDKVIQTVNDYELNVFNGDIGYIDVVDYENETISVLFKDGSLACYDRDKISNLKLGYAISIHKSQGSEFPVVVIPLSQLHHVMLQRKLIYTALSRAKKFALLVGEYHALQMAVSNYKTRPRQTQLKRWLRGSS